MSNWLSRLFGFGGDKPQPAPATPTVTATAAPSSAPKVVQFPAAVGGPSLGPRLRPVELEFLDGFLASPVSRSLDEMPVDDRLFIAGIRHRWHMRQLDLPVLPQAALKLRELLRHGDVAIPRFVELLEEDSALTVEVLKAANSAQLGAATTVTSTGDAIVRIGLQRLETILLLAQTKAKVLKGGPVQVFGETLVGMAMPLAAAASKLAAEAGEDANLAFTRGTLIHVEHLVILGALPDVSREHKRMLSPSVAALHQAFAEYGPEIRRGVAKLWGLEDLLVGGDDAAMLSERFVGLRNALASQWLRHPLPIVTGVESNHLEAVMTEVSVRAAA